MKYDISLYGCDDSTTITLDLTRDGVELIERLEELFKQASTCGCMPTLGIEASKDN